MKMLIKSCAIILLSITFCSSEISMLESNDSQEVSVRMAFDYVMWRNLGQVVIFDSLKKKGVSKYAMELTKYFSDNGIYSSLHSSKLIKDIRDVLHIPAHRLCIILLLTSTKSDGILIKASRNRLFKEYYSWFLITPNNNVAAITDKVRNLSLELSTDLVIGTLSEDMLLRYKHKKLLAANEGLLDIKKRGAIEEWESIEPDEYSNRSHNSEDIKRILKGTSGKRNQTKITNFGAEDDPFYIRQIYKIRRDDNTSVIIRNLGNWSPTTGFKNVIIFQPVELRNNFYGFPLMVGLKNDSIKMNSQEMDSLFLGIDQVRQPDYEDDNEDIEEMVALIAKSLNATVKIVVFDDIGCQAEDGEWTDLLGAVVSEAIDLAIERVPVTNEKLDYMSFTHTIITASRNLYLHPTEYSTVRDIYITPFSPRLMLCVLCTGVILALSMCVITLHTAKRYGEDRQVSDATIWAVGILSMQGSTWTPTTTSGSIVLMFALVFALIMYNSYAAFITSILSVHSSDINTLDDIFKHNYQVGYVMDSEDETYLQQQNNELSRIYAAGITKRVTDIEEGLLMAAKTKYALFVSGAKGRKALGSLSPYESRCQVQEFVLSQTRENQAFPMSKGSPYFKIINLSVFRLKESGSLHKMRDQMIPSMPVCQFSTLFTSASTGDVSTAFNILIFGGGMSLFIIMCEFMWKRRRQIKKKFSNRGTRQLKNNRIEFKH